MPLAFSRPHQLSIYFVNAHRDAVPAVDNFKCPLPDATISDLACPRRRGDRIEVIFAAVHESVQAPNGPERVV